MKILKEKKWNGRNISPENILEYIYLILFSVLIAYHFFLTTTFQIEWPSIIKFYLNAMIVLILVLKTGADEKYNLYELLVIGILGIAFLVSWRHNENEEILLCMLVIWGARKIRFDKILKIYCAVIGTLLIFTMVCALTGQIDNLVFAQPGRRPRIAFGICYPTDFSAYVFYLSAAYCYLRRETLKYIETVVVAALGIFVYYFCDARLNTVCLLMTAVAFTYLIYRKRHTKNQYEMSRVLSGLLAVSPTICAFVMIVFSMLYSRQNPLMVKLNSILNNRLYYGKKAMEVYGIPIWGQNMPMRGNGGSVEKVNNYFFLDSSYLYVLLQFGLLTLGILLICWCLITFKAMKKKNWAMLIAVALISVQCMVEHHIMAIVYNPFFMALLADWEINKMRGKDR